MAEQVRVRFAPSPTGYLHMGGARTALFNWLFARHEGGRFILRIEDTDVQRSSAELEEQLLEDLHWLGLEWDEGPRRGGPRGPYRQSERAAVYRELAERLISQGDAYPCFCTDEELERKKSEMIAAGLPPQYDGTCRSLTGDERERCRRDGLPESIRFAFPEAVSMELEDTIRGHVVFPPGMVGDFIIIRSNGLPTYNFAAAVDDALMGITHVIRGEEHLSNTLRQIVVYEALGFQRPRFVHIPLILGSDRSKLSKRHGAPNIADFTRNGYPAEAIVNYLAFLGWSPGDEREILSREELIAAFTLERVSSSPSIFDLTKLNWMSSHYIRTGGVGRYFEEALSFFPGEVRERYGRGELEKMFAILSENLPSFSAIPAEVAPFMPGPPPFEGEVFGMIEGRGGLLAAFADGFARQEGWGRDELRKTIKSVGKKLAVKGKDLYMPLRIALTGSVHGPDLVSILEIRGREDVVNCIERARERAGS
ncbi:MAG TPA: glutamate--tRNA ligase [Patescibacteria group bacterium]|nr:glutamate--tRNA ligase [Patescibacteria group bacterium]